MLFTLRHHSELSTLGVGYLIFVEEPLIQLRSSQTIMLEKTKSCAEDIAIPGLFNYGERYKENDLC